MSRICKITGKRPRVANNVSKANNKTKRKQYPNLQNKKIFVPETGKYVNLRISTKALKTAKSLSWYNRSKDLLKIYKSI